MMTDADVRLASLAAGVFVGGLIWYLYVVITDMRAERRLRKQAKQDMTIDSDNWGR